VRQAGLTMYHLFSQIYGVLRNKAVTEITVLHGIKLELEEGNAGTQETSGRKLFQPLWREDQNGSTAHLDQFLPLEASQHTSDSLTRATDQVG